MREKKVTGWDYLWCALYACAGFAFELLLVAVEKGMGIEVSDFTTRQNIVHWILTTVGWIGIGCLVIFIAKKTTGFHIWEKRAKMKGWQYAAVVLCFAVNIAAKYMDWNGFKVVIEFQKLGGLLFAFQYIYYLAEGFLISLVIVFAQTACEKWFRNEKIPYGGIILACTWGLAHIVSKGSLWVGILAAFGGFLFGTAYLFVNKDYRKALPVITLLFVL